MLASILAIALAAHAAPPAAPPTPTTQSAPVTSAAVIHGAVQFHLTSKNTGRSYLIYVYKPHGTPPQGGFPVLYVLDGDASFATATMEASLGRLDGLSPIMVVGIGYYSGNPFLRRNADLTPSRPTGHTLTEMEESFGPAKPGDYGDAENYYRFLTKELRPIIDNSFSGNPQKQSLMGYSFGGLFALHVLFHHPNSFQTYVVGSPSIWWNDREVLKNEAAFRALVTAGKTAPRILITSNEWEQFAGSPSLPPPSAERHPVLAENTRERMVDNARDLANRLKALKGSKGYEVRYTLFPQETHLSGWAGAISRGITFVGGH